MGTSAKIAAKLREGAEHASGRVVNVAVTRDFLANAAEILDAVDKVDWNAIEGAVIKGSMHLDRNYMNFHSLLSKMRDAGLVR